MLNLFLNHSSSGPVLKTNPPSTCAIANKSYSSADASRSIISFTTSGRLPACLQQDFRRNLPQLNHPKEKMVHFFSIRKTSHQRRDRYLSDLTQIDHIRIDRQMLVLPRGQHIVLL